MKRTKIKRVSKRPIRKLLTDADKALQNWYRATYPYKRCEVCGRPFNLVHHFIEKSQSSFLRFDERNLIPLCTSCHCRHHLSGDPAIVGTIIKKRGIEWFNELQKLRRGYIDLNRQFLEGQLEKYKVIHF